MSSYKSNAPRRTTEFTTEVILNPKLQEKVLKLQELFPTWSNDDLHSVLAETGSDVDLAAARISEGHAEQWGSVTRKKEKKVQHSSVSHSHSSRPDREKHNSEFRGGGRGGRGGRGRGGSGRGSSRVPLQSLHHSHPKEPFDATAVTTFSTIVTHATNEPSPDSGVVSAETNPDATGAGAETFVSSTLTHHDTAYTTDLNEAIANSTFATGSTEPVPFIKSQPGNAKPTTGSKLSWAQIAKPQEKSKTTPPHSLPAVSRPLLPSASIPTTVSETVPPASEQFETSIWEEPTTVQAPPAWEEEPAPALPVPTSQSSENHVTTTGAAATASGDGWISTEAAASALPTRDAWELKSTLPAVSPPSSTQEPPSWGQAQSTSELSANISTTTDTFTTPASITPSASITSAPTSTTNVSPKLPTPSVAHARPLGIHRSSAKFSKDQAVFISALAGNVTSHTDKLGMQFGSLSLNGDDAFDSSIKMDNESITAIAPDVPKQQILLQSQRTQVAVQTQPQETVQSSAPTSVNTVAPPSQHVYSQSAPQHQTPPSAVPIQAQQQAAQTSQPLHPVTSFSLHPSAAPNLTHQQQQPLLTPQHQHTQQYGHHQQNVPFDGSQLQNPHGAGSQSSSYFRHDAPFYHAPTPPQNAPDHQSGYPAAFSPVGMGAGLHGHSQNLGAQNITHLGGFSGIAGGEYSYSDGQRSFYDYVPGNFNSRIGHDESGKTGLPLTPSNQQPSSVLSSSANQTQNSNGHQSSSSQPPTGQQNQQGYPPMQYFYPTFFPNTYHPPPYPNASYSQPYVPKFPVYPQGPVGPSSAPSGKGLGGPYNPSGSQSHLYHSQNGFDDPTNGYSHSQSSSSLGAAEFQKQAPHHQQPQQLYGGQQNQSLQSFLNMQQTAAAGQSVGGTSQSRSGTSPETSYKHYGGGGGPPDKPNVGIAQSAPQSRSANVQQGQQQGGSFYPNARFGGTGGPQQQNQQQGYTQGSDQGQFYSYQHRHQQAYWQ